MILAPETATRSGSICLARGEQVIGAISGDAAASHSVDLLENIGRLLLKADKTQLGDVDVFA